MFEIFQDSMSITCFFRYPDIFETMTANPRWREISEFLMEGQASKDCRDLIAHMFKIKKKSLLHDILHLKILRDVVEHVHTIKF